MKRFVVADTHFGHANIIKYCSRPFVNISMHDHAIMTNWNSLVKPEDLVIIVGDFGWGSKSNIIKWADRLNGSKILIKGNHDRKNKVRGIGNMRVVDDYLIIDDMIFIHNPDNVMVKRGILKDKIIVAGHHHEKVMLATANSGRKYINVSIDALYWQPVNLEHIMEMRDNIVKSGNINKYLDR